MKLQTEMTGGDAAMAAQNGAVADAAMDVAAAVEGTAVDRTASAGEKGSAPSAVEAGGDRAAADAPQPTLSEALRGEIAACVKKELAAALGEQISAALGDTLKAQLHDTLRSELGAVRETSGARAPQPYRMPVMPDYAAMSDAEYYRARKRGEITLH